jgi:hypothetical protein
VFGAKCKETGEITIVEILLRPLELVYVLSDDALNRLYDQSPAFQLYAEHANGMSVSDLALLYSKTEGWVMERMVAIRFCLEKQVYLTVSNLVPCADSVWSGQVWD